MTSTQNVQYAKNVIIPFTFLSFSVLQEGTIFTVSRILPVREKWLARFHFAKIASHAISEK